MAMKRLKNEFNSLVNRGVDRHLRLAVTGLSRSGKTAFITAMVNQLLNLHAGARLPLLSAAREERLLGVKRVPQRDFGIPRFTYDEGLAQLYGTPPAWPTPTRGVSEIRLALRFRSNESVLRHFKDTSTLYLEIVDYPGEWLLDLPMLAQDYLSWSRQMTGLLQGQRAEWSAKWRELCAGLDPLAPADENRLAAIAQAWTDYLHQCKQQGLHFIQPGRFVLPGEMAGAPALQFFPWPDVDSWGESKLAMADKHTNVGMLRDRFNYYCENKIKQKMVKGIIMLSSPANESFFPRLDTYGIPVVVIGKVEGDFQNIYSVDTDNFHGSMTLTDTFIRNGHRKIACLHAPVDYHVSIDRLAGYKASLEKHNIAFNADWVVDGGYTHESALDAACQLLSSAQPPRAVFATDSMKLLALYRAAEELNLMIPEQLAIAGYTDPLLSLILTPAPAGFEIPTRQLGEQSCDVLFKRIAGKEAPRQVIVDTALSETPSLR
jgi:hypothetical protein